MASIKTNKGRQKLAKAHAGTAALPAIAYIAFGSGGVDMVGIKGLTGAENALFKEVKRMAPVVTFPNSFTARYSGTIDAAADNLVGTNINEACLIDTEGDVVAIKTFSNKGLDEKTVIEFDYDANF